ncbi:hypothetical protein [Sphingopyxis sp.]|uniref:hypothetical protein n=1 Tax=Sphingopyxis sp. TaxID=1908224 RepID=UPI0025D7E066|nr:hypothetical protein [Sphingopyxis sp.]MBR2174478.1 hypothetical protein [Sphingopyxis sp.]
MSNKLTDAAEVMFRQIHPDLLQDGEPASSGFRPKESDKDKLSVDRGALTTPVDAHTLFTSNGYQSIAVYGVSVGEFDDCGIPCEPDPLAAEDGKAANPAHALASFSDIGTSKQKTLAKKIKKAAVARGILHPPPPPLPDEEASH